MAIERFAGPWPLFSSLIVYTVGRIPWTGDQSVARPLPTQTDNKRTHPCLECDSNPRPSPRAGEDRSCLRSRCRCDRLQGTLLRETWLSADCTELQPEDCSLHLKPNTIKSTWDLNPHKQGSTFRRNLVSPSSRWK